jgi:hypothetical protein
VTDEEFLLDIAAYGEVLTGKPPAEIVKSAKSKFGDISLEQLAQMMIQEITADEPHPHYIVTEPRKQVRLVYFFFFFFKCLCLWLCLY